MGLSTSIEVLVFLLPVLSVFKSQDLIKMKLGNWSFFLFSRELQISESTFEIFVAMLGDLESNTGIWENLGLIHSFKFGI